MRSGFRPVVSRVSKGEPKNETRTKQNHKSKRKRWIVRANKLTSEPTECGTPPQQADFDQRNVRTGDQCNHTEDHPVLATQGETIRTPAPPCALSVDGSAKIVTTRMRKGKQPEVVETILARPETITVEPNGRVPMPFGMDRIYDSCLQKIITDVVYIRLSKSEVVGANHIPSWQSMNYANVYRGLCTKQFHLVDTLARPIQRKPAMMDSSDEAPQGEARILVKARIGRQDMSGVILISDIPNRYCMDKPAEHEEPACMLRDEERVEMFLHDRDVGMIDTHCVSCVSQSSSSNRHVSPPPLTRVYIAPEDVPLPPSPVVSRVAETAREPSVDFSTSSAPTTCASRTPRTMLHPDAVMPYFSTTRRNFCRSACSAIADVANAIAMNTTRTIRYFDDEEKEWQVLQWALQSSIPPELPMSSSICEDRHVVRVSRQHHPARPATLHVAFPTSCTILASALSHVVVKYSNRCSAGYSDEEIVDDFATWVMRAYCSLPYLQQLGSAVFGRAMGRKTISVISILTRSHYAKWSQTKYAQRKYQDEAVALHNAVGKTTVFGVPIVAVRRNHYANGHGMAIEHGHVDAVFQDDPEIVHLVRRVIRALRSKYYNLPVPQVFTQTTVTSVDLRINDGQVTEAHHEECAALKQLRKGFAVQFIRKRFSMFLHNVPCDCQNPAVDYQVGGSCGDPLCEFPIAIERFIGNVAVNCASLEAAGGMCQHFRRIVENKKEFVAMYCRGTERDKEQQYDAAKEATYDLNFYAKFVSRARANTLALMKMGDSPVEPNHNNRSRKVEISYALDEMGWLSGRCNVCGALSPKRAYCPACRLANKCPKGHFMIHAGGSVVDGKQARIDGCGICEVESEAYRRDLEQLVTQHVPWATRQIGVRYFPPFFTFAKRLLKVGEVDATCKFVVHDKTRSEAPQKGVLATGITFNAHVPIVGHCDAEAAYCSMTTRQLAKVTPPDVPLVQHLRRTMETHVFDLTPACHMLFNDRYVHRAKFSFYANRFPPARRRTLYESLYLYNQFGVVEKMAERYVFLKHEKLEYGRAGDTPEGKASRVICAFKSKPFGLVPQVISGPFFYNYGKALKELWNGKEQLADGSPNCPLIYYASGSTAEEIGAWIDRWAKDFPEILDGDYSKFDKSIGHHLLCAEHAWYLRFLPKMGDEVDSQLLADFRKVLRWQLKPRGKVMIKQRIVAEFQTEGRRSSGDSNTSCGNALLNAALIVSFLSQKFGGVDAVAENFRLAVCGDDSMILSRIPTRVWAREMVSWIARLGQTLEVNERSHISQAQFVGGRPIRAAFGAETTPRTVLVPAMERWLTKHGWALDAWTNHHAYLRGVALGWNSLIWVPVLGAVVQREIELTSKSQTVQKLDRDDQYKCDRYACLSGYRCHPATFKDLEIAYGWSFNTILEIEAVIKSVRQVPAMVCHPEVDRVIGGVDGVAY